MRALVFDNGRAAVRDVRRPAPRNGFALVRVLLSGICNTDLELRRGYHGFSGIPGHEFVGVVEGPATSPRLGRRVVGEINLACGRCSWCAKGLGRHCPKRTVLGIRRHAGAHAERLTLPEANLFEVPAGVTDEEAVFVEPLAAACEILDQVAVAPGTRAAVLGPGKLGRLAAAVLGTVGADVISSRTHDAREGRVVRPRRRGHGVARGHAASAGAREATRDDRVEVHASHAGSVRRRAPRRERGDRRRVPLRTLCAGPRAPQDAEGERPSSSFHRNSLSATRFAPCARLRARES